MGREIRKVPEGWQHPTTHCRSARQPERLPYEPGCFPHDVWQPMINRTWLSDYREWWFDRARARILRPLFTIAALLGLLKTERWYKWLRFIDKSHYDDEAIPEPRHYRPSWREKKRTHYQLYETVSEGTPLSPPFPTKLELAHWLEAHPHKHIGGERLTADHWLEFIEQGYAPSFVMTNDANGVVIKSGVEAVVG